MASKTELLQSINRINDPETRKSALLLFEAMSGDPTDNGVSGSEFAVVNSVTDPLTGRIEIIGVNLTPRPKFASFGNSINGRNCHGETSAGAWSAWGFLNWIYALSGGGFERAATTATTWSGGASGQTETLDAYGNYGAPGARTAQMRDRLLLVLDKFIDAPDYFYFSSVTENDIGGDVTSSAIIRNIDMMIAAVLWKFPKCKIVIATPGPSTSYSTQARIDCYNTVKAYIKSLHNGTTCLVETNDAMGVGAGIVAAWSDGAVHQNELGAIARAKAFVADTTLKQIFVPLNFPLIPSTTDAGWASTISFQLNPDLSAAGIKTGSPGQNVAGTTYKSIDWYVDTNVGFALTQNPTGLQMDIWPNTGFTTGGLGPTTDASAISGISSASKYQAHARVKVLNASGLRQIGAGGVQYKVGGGANTNLASFLFFQGTFNGDLGTLILPGDVLTFSTAPEAPQATSDTVAYVQVKCTMLSNLAATNAKTASTPSIEYQAINVVKVG